MSNQHLIAFGLGALGLAAISAPYLAARVTENQRARRVQHGAAVRGDAVRMLAEATAQGGLRDILALNELVERAWGWELARHGGRGAGGLGPRYTEAAFRRAATEYALSYLLTYGRLPAGEHLLSAEWVGVVQFDAALAGEA